MEMLDNDLRRIVARLHRIEGQLRGLENQLNNNEDVLSVVAQFDAVISATKGALSSYATGKVDSLPEEQQKKLISRFIKKN